MDNGFYNSTMANASDAKLLVTIPLWYRPARLIYLVDMIRTLSEFAVARLDMLILTQSCDDDQLKIVDRIIAPYRSDSKTFRVVSVYNLADQFALCWEHRKIFKDIFIGSKEYTHFVYFEDDIRFSFLNF